MNSKVNYDQALEFLKLGEVVSVPTETVYGLAGRIDRLETLKKIFSLKKRPSFDPLIVHCYDSIQAEQYMLEVSQVSKKLWECFAPGPLTLVVPKNEKIFPIITAHQPTVALRIPKHPLMRQLLKDIQVPLAAPSANLYSQISPTEADHVVSAFSGQVPVLDGGVCEVGLESTIVQPRLEKKQIEILRPGVITAKDLQSCLKDFDFSITDNLNPQQPGGQKEHYKPSVPLIIVEREIDLSDLKKLLKSKYPQSTLQFLELTGSSYEVARSLYADLRKLSKNKTNIIVVQKTKKHQIEVWKAIWNRLEKAASEKIN